MIGGLGGYYDNTSFAEQYGETTNDPRVIEEETDPSGELSLPPQWTPMHDVLDILHKQNQLNDAATSGNGAFQSPFSLEDNSSDNVFTQVLTSLIDNGETNSPDPEETDAEETDSETESVNIPLQDLLFVLLWKYLRNKTKDAA